MNTKICALNVHEGTVVAFTRKHLEFSDTGREDTTIVLERTVLSFTYLGRAKHDVLIRLNNPNTNLVLFSEGGQTIFVEGLADEHTLHILKLNDSLLMVTPPAAPEAWRTGPEEDIFI